MEATEGGADQAARRNRHLVGSRISQGVESVNPDELKELRRVRSWTRVMPIRRV